MSYGLAADAIHKTVSDKVSGAAAFRATVTAVSGQLISIRREGEATGSGAQYATLAGVTPRVGDVVLCLPLGANGTPVIVGVIAAAASTATTYTILAGAGTGASASIVGDDTSGTVTVTTGTGTASGTFVEIDFSVAKANTSYSVQLTRADVLAGSVDVRATGKTVNRFRLDVPTALSVSTTFVWDYQVRQFG